MTAKSMTLPERWLDRAGAYPRRPRRRRPLHVKELAGDPVRIALHHHRAIGNVRKQNVGDAEVVAKQIAFRQPKRRKVNLSQIGQRDAATVDLNGRIVHLARNGNRGTAALPTLRHDHPYTRTAMALRSRRHGGRVLKRVHLGGDCGARRDHRLSGRRARRRQPAFGRALLAAALAMGCFERLWTSSIRRLADSAGGACDGLRRVVRMGGPVHCAL